MSDTFRCPKTVSDCQNATICEQVNEPLKGSVVRIRQKVGGVSWRLAKSALIREINVQFHPLGAEVYPRGDGDEGVSICPRDLVRGELADKMGADIVALGAQNIAEKCIGNVVKDLSHS